MFCFVLPPVDQVSFFPASVNETGGDLIESRGYKPNQIPAIAASRFLLYIKPPGALTRERARSQFDPTRETAGGETPHLKKTRNEAVPKSKKK